jgi:hypothetical protein
MPGGPPPTGWTSVRPQIRVVSTCVQIGTAGNRVRGAASTHSRRRLTGSDVDCVVPEPQSPRHPLGQAIQHGRNAELSECHEAHPRLASVGFDLETRGKHRLQQRRVHGEMQEEGIFPPFVVHKADGLPAQLRGGGFSGELAVTNQKGSCFRQKEYHDGSPQGLLAPCSMSSYPTIRDVGKSQEESWAFQEFPAEEFSSKGQHDIQFAISDIDLMTPFAQEHNFWACFNLSSLSLRGGSLTSSTAPYAHQIFCPSSCLKRTEAMSTCSTTPVVPR